MRRGIVSQAVYERSIERPLAAAGVFSGERDIAAIFPGVYWPSTALLQVLWTAFVFPGRK